MFINFWIFFLALLICISNLNFYVFATQVCTFQHGNSTKIKFLAIKALHLFFLTNFSGPTYILFAKFYRPYAYWFCQIFQALRLFPAIRLLRSLEYLRVPRSCQGNISRCCVHTSQKSKDMKRQYRSQIFWYITLKKVIMEVNMRPLRDMTWVFNTNLTNKYSFLFTLQMNFKLTKMFKYPSQQLSGPPYTICMIPYISIFPCLIVRSMDTSGIAMLSSRARHNGFKPFLREYSNFHGILFFSLHTQWI